MDETLAQRLPISLRYYLLEKLGSDMYAAVTGDRDRADTLLITEGRLHDYFDSRPFDYVLEDDARLKYFFRGLELARLPMLAAGWYQCYAASTPDRDVASDPLVIRFFYPADTEKLPLLIRGEYMAYFGSMPAGYEVSRDLLFKKYMRTVPVEKLELCMIVFVRIEKYMNKLKTDTSYRKSAMLLCMIQRYLADYKKNKLDVPDALQLHTMCRWLAKNTRGINMFSLFQLCSCGVMWRLEEHEHFCDIMSRDIAYGYVIDDQVVMVRVQHDNF